MRAHLAKRRPSGIKLCQLLLRPATFDKWFKVHRPAQFVKVDPQAFGAQLRAWWRALQPAERDDDGSAKLRRCSVPENEWGALRKSGHNGFFLILLGLAWWRSSAINTSDRLAWHEMVDDVLWVLQEWRRDVEKPTSSSPSPTPSSPRLPSTPPRQSTSNAGSSPADNLRRSKRKMQDPPSSAKRVRCR